mmetsp:Transcript_53869/g.114445  ORF Transcript_53869/g.114445 Transcript_53869/m.114445 type:complete len:164 (-) Transcript_53869:312-803(-)
MTSIKHAFGILLLAATALAADENPTGAAAAGSNMCPDEAAAFNSCGLSVENTLTCPLCIGTAMGGNDPNSVDLTDADALASMCANIMGSYCGDLDKCVAENCPEACRESLRALSACTLKAGGCVVNCGAEVTGTNGGHAEGLSPTLLAMAATMYLGSVAVMML